MQLLQIVFELLAVIGIFALIFILYVVLDVQFGGNPSCRDHRTKDEKINDIKMAFDRGVKCPNCNSTRFEVEAEWKCMDYHCLSCNLFFQDSDVKREMKP